MGGESVTTLPPWPLAVVVKVSLHKTIAVCNVYIPPRFNVAQRDLDNLVNQLPAPFYLLEILMHIVVYGVVPHPIV